MRRRAQENQIKPILMSDDSTFYDSSISQNSDHIYSLLRSLATTGISPRDLVNLKDGWLTSQGSW